MKIAILSRSLRAYSTKRLKEAAIEKGHQVKVLDTLRFSMMVESGDPDLHYAGKHLSHYDAVIPRIGQSITFYGLAVVRQFEQMGVYCANGSVAIANSRDKLRSMQILSRHDVGLPPTAFVRDKTDVMNAIDRVGGVPVIIKLLEGTQGVGVILAETTKVAKAIIETLHSAQLNVLIQKFVKESEGTDIRAFVVGDHVVGAMRRRAMPGEFRSNVHRGGSVENVTLDKEYERTAVRAAQIMGLRVAGVDMLEGNDGPQIMEVNSSPGLEGIERATEKDIAGEVIKNVEEHVLFPEVDLRQRLRLAAGYGAAEFTVHNMPGVIDKPLRETIFPDKNIHVVSINRNGTIIPNPKGDDEVFEGDTLLCFGELAELRGIMPERKQKKRKDKSKKTKDSE